MMRMAANIVILIGLFVFARILYNTANGHLAEQLFTQPQGSFSEIFLVLGLSLPIPLHIISVGLILQRKRLSRFWSRIAWVAAVISGCWLGTALGIKFLLI